MFLRLAALFIKIQMNIITGLLAVIKQWGFNLAYPVDEWTNYYFPIPFTQQVLFVIPGTQTPNDTFRRAADTPTTYRTHTLQYVQMGLFGGEGWRISYIAGGF